jgi:hypothetical protein
MNIELAKAIVESRKKVITSEENIKNLLHMMDYEVSKDGMTRLLNDLCFEKGKVNANNETIIMLKQLGEY